MNIRFNSFISLMLVSSLILLLLSNSVTLRRDKSILFSRSSISILAICNSIIYDNLHILFLNTGIGIFGGLFHISSTSCVFYLFIISIVMVIILLSSYRIWVRRTEDSYFSKKNN